VKLYQYCKSEATEEIVIDQYVRLLHDWNIRMNLVQARSFQYVLDRHIKDSQQICRYIDKNSCIMDVGSGAGFPGVILSIFGCRKVTLCEKNFRKVVFLREVRHKLGLDFEVYHGNVYDIPSITFKKNVTFVSRAFGSVSDLLFIMEKFAIEYGVFHKGKNHMEEIESAKKYFLFDFQVEKSITSSEGAIILISNPRKKQEKSWR
jgi:16S rRNA (guanine527-N7)-methyltransferase